MNSKRTFKLPLFQHLTKEQRVARALSADGQYLIQGGPGTGKSVVALMRCKLLETEKKNYVFIVYNKLLHRFTSQIYGQGFFSAQWQSWFIKRYKEHTREELPRLVSNKSFKPFNWTLIIETIQKIGPTNSVDLPYLVIDEGQDMPPQFYQAVVEMGYVNLYVAADQNQQLNEHENSTIREIADGLALDMTDIIKLDTNFRNNQFVANLAHHFNPDEHKQVAPTIDSRNTVSSGGKPMMFVYKEKQFGSMIKKILLLVDRMPQRLIGVITPNDDSTRDKYYKALKNVECTFRAGRPTVDTYSYNKTFSEPRFDMGGIMVINAASCKGLEFDDVFIVDIDQGKVFDELTFNKSLYVMVSRALGRVFFLRSGFQNQKIDKLLPRVEDGLFDVR
jgi:DNA helicase II / ATP-dependent DNA helicase PcrA